MEKEQRTHHEAGDDAVEQAAFVGEQAATLAHALLTGAQGHKVGARLRRDIRAQLNYDAPRRCAADGHVQVRLGQRQRRHGDSREPASRRHVGLKRT